MAGNLVLSITSIILAVFYLIVSLQLPPSASPITLGPRVWPMIILTLMALMGIVLLIRTIKERRSSTTKDPEGLLAQSEKIEEEFEVEEVYKSKYLLVGGVLFLTLLALSYLGFILSSIFMIIAVAYIIGIKKWMPIILSSIIGTACLAYLFPVVLGVLLPRGVGIFKQFSLLFY